MVNPLLQPSPLPYGLPPFDVIDCTHVEEAVRIGIEEQRQEIERLCAAETTWENLVEGFERSGTTLDRASAWLFNMASTDSDEDIDAVTERVIPALSQHEAWLYQHPVLFSKLREVEVPEDEESQRLYSRLMDRFIRRGAALADDERARLKDIDAQLDLLADSFRKALSDDTSKAAVRFTSAEELDGLDAEDIESLRTAEGTYVLPIELPTVQSALSALTSAKSREVVLEASLSRGRESNVDTLVTMARLRAERARILGFQHHADFVIAQETAGNADAVAKLLADLAPAAAANAEAERKLVAEHAGVETLSAADWPYWAARLAEHDSGVADATVRRYFHLDRVLVDGVFAAAHRLYGITVEARKDLRAYHPSAQVWEVFDEDGSGVGLLITDYQARQSKRGGAWMSTFVGQSRLLEQRPVVVNVMSLTSELLTPDDVHTIFHEFGHALHGLLSNVRYPSLSGTNVPRDWVEFPSQINENWAFDPAVLPRYARHAETHEPIPEHYAQAIAAARRAGQGFATVEYLAAAVVDLAWHTITEEQAESIRTIEDVDAFEREALEEAGLTVEGLYPRYRSTYFNHIFGGGYSAGYYSYLWAEALDADGFEWFREVGAAGERADDRAARQAGQRFRDLILSRGAAADYASAYAEFRGRERSVDALLRRRGLAGAL